MRYALVLNNIEPSAGEIPDEAMASMQAAFVAYADALDQAGVLRSADILAPSDDTSTVRMLGGSMSIQDGPFVEARQMMSGVFVIDVTDRDAALAWAAKCPAATYGAIEVRPVAISYLDGVWQS